MNMRVVNDSIRLAKDVAGQAVGKISIPKLGLSINKASLKMLKDASKAGNSIAAHISKSIESGQLFEFASKLLELGEQMYSTPALQGRDSDKQPITHKPVVKFKPGQEGLDLDNIYMQGPDEKLHGWDPSSHTGTTSPSPNSAAPQGQPAPDKSHLPRRPPADANSLAPSYQQYKSQKPQTQASPQPRPEPKPSAKDTAPPLSENVKRDLEPDLKPRNEAAPERSRLPPKQIRAQIAEALKALKDARKTRRERRQKRKARKQERAINSLRANEEQRANLQGMLNGLNKSRGDSVTELLQRNQEQAKGINYQ